MCNTCGCKKAESFDWDNDDWRDWGEGMTIPQMAKALSKMSWDEVDEETGYGDDLFDWFNKWDKKSQKERETYALRVLKESYGAESFDADYFKESKHLKPSSPSNLSKYFAKKYNYIYIWIEDENGDYGVVGGKLHEGEFGPMDVPVAIPLKADIKKLVGFDGETFEAPRKKIFRGKRPSPSTSATSVNIGTKMKGGNGKLWVCKSYPRGKARVKRWVLAAEDFNADFDKAPYDSWDDAWADDIEFPPMNPQQRIGEENLFIKNLTVVGALAGVILLGKALIKN